MTTPNERTKALTDTRELLKMLASADEITIGGLVQSVAIGLLRHYPLDIDLEVSAGVLPGIWAVPEHSRAGSTATLDGPDQKHARCDVDAISHRGGGDGRAACGS